jgi:hypothetical protein
VLAVWCMEIRPGGHGREGVRVKGKAHTVVMSRLDQREAMRGLFA